MVWYGIVNVDLYSAIITKVSNALNTLVSGEKPGFQALSKGLVVLLCAEVVTYDVFAQAELIIKHEGGGILPDQRGDGVAVLRRRSTARLEQSAGRDQSQPISDCLQTFTENSLLCPVFLLTLFLITFSPRAVQIVKFP